MKFMVCPQCGISNFYITNANGNRLNVKVTRELKIITKDESQSIDGYDASILYCLGCSWRGTINKLVKYINH